MQLKKVFSLAISTLLLAILMAAPYRGAAQNFTFTTIDYPGAVETGLAGINESGQIAGNYFACYAGCEVGLLLTGGSNFQSFNFPGATETHGYEINNLGEIAGYVLVGGVYHGYVRRSGGNFETIDFPGAQSSAALDINEQTQGQKSTGGEVQHIFQSKYVSLTSGFGYFDFKRQSVQSVDLVVGGVPIFQLSNETANLNTKQTNAYMYSYIKPLSNLTFTLGVSGDFYNAQSDAFNPDKNQINPKFGMVWNPLPDTTVRAAAFRPRHGWCR